LMSSSIPGQFSCSMVSGALFGLCGSGKCRIFRNYQQGLESADIRQRRGHIRERAGYLPQNHSDGTCNQLHTELQRVKTSTSQDTFKNDGTFGGTFKSIAQRT
jgi:hypothetical protein